jgi:capsular polysaccharide biosynthesis protein
VLNLTAVRVPGLLGRSRLGRVARAGLEHVRSEAAVRQFLESCEALLDGSVPSHVVVLCSGSSARGWATTMSKAYPSARVTLLAGGTKPSSAPGENGPPRVEILACRNLHHAHAALLERPAPDLLVDVGGCPASLRFGVFSHLLPALSDGGRYLLLDGGATVEPELDDRAGESLPALIERLGAVQLQGDAAASPPPDHDDLERVRAMGPRTVHGRVLQVPKVGRHLAKVREDEVDRVVPARLGAGRSEVLESRPAKRFESRAVLRSNRPDLDDALLRTCDVPPRTLRVQRDVVCFPRQLALADDVMLPASFHHPQARRLRNRHTVDASRWYARLRHEPDEIPALAGTWYHLASEFPGHFGHVMTEDLSRLWGWDQAQSAHGDLKLLLGAGDPVAPEFVNALLTAFGVPRADLHVASTPVRVERLVTATPQLHNGRYVDPDIDETWQRVTRGLQDPALALPRRIFVTRPETGERRCLNAAVLEARFVEAGFSVVRPETMLLAEQVSMFAGAEVVAGYAGSGLFTALASPPGTAVVVVSSDSYYAVNEWLISSVKGFDHYQLWCPSTRPKTSKGFDARSFHADFRFDVERDSGYLDEILQRFDR